MAQWVKFLLFNPQEVLKGRRGESTSKLSFDLNTSVIATHTERVTNNSILEIFGEDLEGHDA